MSIQFSGATLRLPTPRTARFLRRTIRGVDTTYVPRDAGIRTAHHQPGTCAPDTWPVRLTRCGEPAGRYGDNHAVRTLQVAR